MYELMKLVHYAIPNNRRFSRATVLTTQEDIKELLTLVLQLMQKNCIMCYNVLKFNNLINY